MRILNSIISGIKFLNISTSLPDQKAEFKEEIYFQNFFRLKVFSFILFVLNIPLLLIDINRINSGISDHIGSIIILFSRIGMLMVVISAFFLLSERKVDEPGKINSFHKTIIRISYLLLILFLTMMAVGDSLVSGSILVYFGAIFTLSIVAILFNYFSFFLYTVNLILIFFTIGFFDQDPNILMNYRINLIAFTLLAWITSRYLFYLKIKEYINRMEREKLIIDLKDAVKNVKLLSGLLPICSTCKKIRDDKGYWNQIESYIIEHSDAAFSHSVCPDCHDKLYSKPE